MIKQDSKGNVFLYPTSTGAAHTEYGVGGKERGQPVFRGRAAGAVHRVCFGRDLQNIGHAEELSGAEDGNGTAAEQERGERADGNGRRIGEPGGKKRAGGVQEGRQPDGAGQPADGGAKGAGARADGGDAAGEHDRIGRGEVPGAEHGRPGGVSAREGGNGRAEHPDVRGEEESGRAAGEREPVRRSGRVDRRDAKPRKGVQREDGGQARRPLPR